MKKNKTSKNGISSMLVVEGWTGMGGVQTFINNLVKSIKKNGNNAYVIVYGKSTKEEAIKNKFRYFAGLKGMVGVLFVALKNKPNTIYLNQPKSLILAPLLSIFSCIIYVVHIDADYFLSTKIKKFYFRILIMMSRAKVYVMSQENIQKLKVYKIPNLKFIRPPLFFRTKDFINAIPSRSFDVIFYGRLAAQKDPIKFLRICKNVHRSYQNLNVCIAGDGPLSKEVDNYISSCNFSITRVGSVSREEGFKLLSNSKLFCMTSTHEGLGFTLIEAAYNGAIPVSGLISSGPLELIKKVGFEVEQNTEEDYKKVILKALTNINLMEIAQKKAVNFSNNYQYDIAIKDYEIN